MTEVYQDANGSWFFRCSLCPGAFEGAFATERKAKNALYNHWLRRHA